MSFYLGTGGSGKIMHITKGSYADTAMQGGILPDTVFHSDLDYIIYDKYAADSIEGFVYNSVKYSTRCRIPLAALAEINLNKWYFVIYKIAGVWYQYLKYVSNSPTNLLWYPTVSSFTGTYYPSSTSLYADLQTGDMTVEDCYFIVIKNLTTARYESLVKPSTDIKVGNGDIVVKGIDLFDLQYINANPINSEDISFYSNSGLMQLVNSAPAVPSTMSLISNSSKTEISLGSKIIFTTLVNRDKVFYSQKLLHTVHYGAVVTSGSGTFYTTVFSAGTFEIGDMFFIKYFVDGNTGKDYDSQSNALLRFVEGLIYTYSYDYLGRAYRVLLDYYGLASGALQIRFRITILSPGTLYSKRYDFTCYKLK